MQSAVDIRVLQGEREFAKDNKQIGVFKLAGIPPAPRGVPQVDVKFDIDANGIVSVSAKDKATGKEQHITIQGSGSLPPSDIERMVKEAKLNEATDKKLREEVEIKNKLETLIFQAEKLAKENDNLPGDDLKLLNESVALARAKLLTGTPEAIVKELEALTEAVQKVSKGMYEAAAAANQQPTAKPAPESEDDGVIDADFEEHTNE